MKRGGVTTAPTAAHRRGADLRRLRNDVPIEIVTRLLGIERRERGRRPLLRCVECGGFNAAVHPRANLVRCFRCARSYNPIDLLMSGRRTTFLGAVRELEEIDRRGARSRRQTPAGGQHLSSW